MNIFESISTFNSSALSESTRTKIEDSLEEKILTKKISEAKKEIEEFSLEADESFLNDATNKLKD